MSEIIVYHNLAILQSIDAGYPVSNAACVTEPCYYGDAFSQPLTFQLPVTNQFSRQSLQRYLQCIMVFDCMFFGIIECCIISSILLHRGINEVCICYLIGMCVPGVSSFIQQTN